MKQIQFARLVYQSDLVGFVCGLAHAMDIEYSHAGDFNWMQNETEFCTI